jgi:hypothetical protein
MMKDEMLRNADVMPRSLIMTLLVGAAIGGTFWAALLVLIVR